MIITSLAFAIYKNDNPKINDNVIREFRLWLNRQSTGNNRATGKLYLKNSKLLFDCYPRIFKIFSATRCEIYVPERIELAKVLKDLSTSSQMKN